MPTLKLFGVALALLALPWVVPPLAAQGPTPNPRVIQALPSRYVAPKCDIKPGHFKVSSGLTYLKTGIETEIPENRQRALASGEKVINEAITQNGQGKNPAAYYFLGRIYLQQGRLGAADSAFAKAQGGLPGCAQDMDAYRKMAWAPLVNAASKFYNEKKPDSAMVLFHQASQIYHGSAIPDYQIGSLLSERSQPDSAAIYFERAARTAQNATDTTEKKIRDRSTFNQAVLYLNASKFKEAVPVFERYLTYVPDDLEAKKGLAASYRGSGQADKAATLEKELVNAPGGGAGGTGGTGVAAQDVMGIGVTAYNAKQYPDAAAAFEKVVAAEPNNRDALYNLANTYLAMKNGPKLLSAARRLVAIDPLNENVLKLEGEGYKQSKNVNEAIKVAEQVLALPVSLEVADFVPSASGAALTARVTGRPAQTAAGKPIAATAKPLTFEFLDAKGNVVTTQQAQLPALKPGAAQPLAVNAQGAGITSWRYKAQ